LTLCRAILGRRESRKDTLAALSVAIAVSRRVGDVTIARAVGAGTFFVNAGVWIDAHATFTRVAFNGAVDWREPLAHTHATLRVALRGESEIRLVAVAVGGLVGAHNVLAQILLAEVVGIANTLALVVAGLVDLRCEAFFVTWRAVRAATAARLASAGCVEIIAIDLRAVGVGLQLSRCAYADVAAVVGQK
jgi:hypothetical protein